MKHTILFLIAFTASTVFGQIHLESIGAAPGAAEFSGNSPATTGLYTGLYTEFKIKGVDGVFFRLQFMECKDFNFIVSSDIMTHYYPYIYGFGLTIGEAQPINESLSLIYGAGFLTLRNRIYDDIDNWAYGVEAHAGILAIVSEKENHIWQIGVEGAYGQTFTTNTPGYLTVYAECRYVFK